MMRKTYIPCTRRTLLERLYASNLLSADLRKAFRDFCTILMALVHHRAHAEFERMKADLYAVDAYEEAADSGQVGKRRSVDALLDDLHTILKRANYHELDESEIYGALNKASIIPVRTSVAFDDFDRFHFYYRSRAPLEVTLKRWLTNKTITIENFDRMVVIFKTGNLPTVDNDESRDDRLAPNRVYLNLYKNVPRQDLELLFPNIQISMTMKDKLMLLVPALGAAIPIALKILPSIGLLIGVIALTVFGLELGSGFDTDKGDQKAIFALFTAILSITLALGGFAAQQYVKYKSKRLGFLKKVTETLFFKTLDVGSGVIGTLVDAAEEERCKEILLAYFLLLTSREPLTKEKLDRAAERWVQDTLGEAINFDVDKALREFEALDEGSETGKLISRSPDGTLRVCELDDANRRLDEIWDNLFRFERRELRTE